MPIPHQPNVTLRPRIRWIPSAQAFAAGVLLGLFYAFLFFCWAVSPSSSIYAGG